jgi:hypothetical protein
LGSNDSLRRKLAACLRWYRFMIATNDLLVDKLITFANMDQASGKSGNTEGEEEEEGEEDWMDTSGPTEACASEYLRQACPACFGGESCTDPDLM